MQSYVCRQEEWVFRWLWLQSFRCSDVGGRGVVYFFWRGGGVGPNEPAAGATWKTAACWNRVTQKGWNKSGMKWEKRREAALIGLLSKAEKGGDWVRKWLRDLSLIVFFQKRDGPIIGECDRLWVITPLIVSKLIALSPLCLRPFMSA